MKKEKIQKFYREHEEFIYSLLDDTYLSEEPISIEEIKATWWWLLHIKVESIPIKLFKKTFGFSFEEFTDYWNSKVLKFGGLSER